MNGCDLDSRARPFHLNPDPRYFYCGPTHRGIVTALIRGIDGHTVPIVLTGQPGTGKTALIHETLLKLPPETYTVLLRYTTLNADDLVHVLASELGIAAAESTEDDQLATVRETLREIGWEGAVPVVIVDEAQNLCELGLSSLCQLTRDGLIKLVLVGQPQLCEWAAALNSEARPGPGATVLKLDNLSAAESRDLVRHRLRVAQQDPDAVFSAEAFRLIYRHTQGNPRRINILCERALQFRSPDGTPDECMVALRDAARSLEEEMPSDVPKQAAGGSAESQAVATSTRQFGDGNPGSPAEQENPGRVQAVHLPGSAPSAPSRKHSAVVFGAMLVLIAVTSWLIQTQFAGEGSVPPAESSDELLSLQAQIDTLSEILAETRANQDDLLDRMTALRSENRSLREELAHPPVIEDFAVLDTALAFGKDSGAVEYWVGNGDTLLGVARRHKLSLSQIARWNGLATSARLRVGERLVLTPREELNYTVRWGDTLVALKRQFDVTFGEFRRWNELPRDGNLYAGQRLRVYVSLPADS